MFNSQKINTDPMPWVIHGAHYAGERRAEKWGDSPHYLQAPRPEFDNNPNPILIALRQCMATCPEDCTDQLAWVEWLWQNDRTEGDMPEHIDHARKVLERLAALTECWPHRGTRVNGPVAR